MLGADDEKHKKDSNTFCSSANNIKS